MACTHTRHKGFTLVELMVVIAIIGILAAIAVPRFTLMQISGHLEAAKPYMAAVAAKMRSNQNEYGVWVNNLGAVTYKAGGVTGGKTYAKYDEQFLEDALGVKLKDAFDYCIMARFNTGAETDTAADGSALTAAGGALNTSAFEIWAVLRDSTYATSADDDVAVAGLGVICRTGDSKNAATGWVGPSGISPGSEGRVAVLRYPPPPNDLRWSDGYRLDGPLGSIAPFDP